MPKVQIASVAPVLAAAALAGCAGGRIGEAQQDVLRRAARTDEGTILAVQALVAGRVEESSALTLGSGTFAATQPATAPAGAALPRAPIGAATPDVLGLYVVADAPPVGAGPREVVYTVRRASDGVAFQVAQPAGPPLSPGARVRITYADRVRLEALR